MDGIYRLSGVTSNIQRLRYTCSTAASHVFHSFTIEHAILRVCVCVNVCI